MAFDTTGLPPKDSNGVRTYTPDATAYHLPDEKQLSLGIVGTVIPRATAHGGSQGFTTAPGVVNIVDVSGEPRTLAAVDMQQLRGKEVTRALAASHGDIGAALTAIGQKQGTPIMAPVKMTKVAAPRTNPLRPGHYVVPRSNIGGGQIIEEEPDMSATHTVPSMQVPLNPSVRSRKPNAPSVVKKAQPRPANAPAVVEYEPQDYQEPDAGPGPATFNPAILFESFGIPCIAPQPQPPTRSVVFHGKFGTLSAHYHDICQLNQALVLIYDNRFKYGAPYVPPICDYALELTLDDGTQHTVHSIGYQFSWGCFDMVCLVRALEPEPQQSAPTAQEMIEAGVYNTPDFPDSQSHNPFDEEDDQ